MKKILSILLVSILILSGVFILTGCDNSNNKGENEKVSETNTTIKKGNEITGSVIKATVPENWILKAGKDIDTVGYVDDSDYIIKGKEVDTSAPTLQIAVAKQFSDNIDNWKDWIESGSFGNANAPFEVNGITWYTAKEGGVALIDGKVIVVYNINGANFMDEEIQSILGSISLIK